MELPIGPSTVLDGECDGDFLMSDGDHDNNLLANDRCSTAQSNGNLTYDDESNINVWLMKGDHQTDAESAHRSTEVEREPLVATRKSDE
jgi:hypothetical protein